MRLCRNVPQSVQHSAKKMSEMGGVSKHADKHELGHVAMTKYLDCMIMSGIIVRTYRSNDLDNSILSFLEQIPSIS